MIEIKKRAKVLRFSLNLEVLASKILSYLLDVENFDKSYSFGNKSSSLSFNQKINLLIDNRSITKDEKKKLVAFASIRNQFMHNINANSFKDAFDHLDGLEKQMRKLYPENFSPEIELEESLEYCISDLHKDGVLIFTSFKGGIDEKIQKEADAKFYKKNFNSLQETVSDSYDRILNALAEHDATSISRSNLIEVIKLLKIRTLSKNIIDEDYIDEILDLLED